MKAYSKIDPNLVQQYENESDYFRGKTLSIVKKEGREEGRKEERADIISQLILSGVSLEDIARLTKVSFQDIKDIEERMKAS